jgi:hypothetical protein
MDSKKFNNEEGGLHVNNVLSIIAGATAALSFLFLLAHGISYTQGYYPSNFNMGQMIFGTAWAGINPGLFSAFILMVLGIVFDVIMNWKKVFSIPAMLCLITSGILWFCTVPLYGNASAGLGAAAWCLGIFNIVDALLIFVGSTYR